MQTIKTARLCIQEVELTDHSFILELVNNPTWLKFIGDKNIGTTEAAQKYIEDNLIKSYQENGFGLYKMVLAASNIPIGLCGFVQRNYLKHPDIGFAVLPQFAGLGYTYEAATALIKYAKEELNLTTILAITLAENIKSRKLLEKIGLSLQKTIIPPDSQESLLLYANQLSEEV